MSVQLICPFCGFSKKLSEKKIPATAKMAVCPRCQEKFPFLRQVQPTDISRDKPPKHSDSNAPKPTFQPHSDTHDTPLENQSNPGLLNVIFPAAKKVLFQPGRFFGTRDPENGLNAPLTFGLLFGGIGDMLAFFWSVLLFSGGLIPFGKAFLGQMDGIWIVILMAAIPIAVVLKMFFYSGILHLMLLIVRGGKEGFNATFRVVAYSQAALAWNIIPFVGSWIGTFWKLGIQVAGLHKVHHISYLRAIMAFLIPFFIFFGLLILSLGPLLMLLRY